MGGVAGVQWGGGGGEEGEEGEEEEAGERAGHLPGSRDLLFLTWEEAEAHLREALEAGEDGDDGDYGHDEGDEGGDKREGGDKGGEVGVTRGLRRKGTRGVRRGVPGARMSPGNPPPRRRGNLRVATREWGPGGAGGLIGLTRLFGEPTTK